MIREPAAYFWRPEIEIAEPAMFLVPYPFCLKDYVFHDADGERNSKTWSPGVEFRMVYPDDGEAFAHAVGYQKLTVVSVHKPGRYPTRVFYTQEWIDPKGTEFGKPGLKMTTLQAFKTKLRGYRFEYVVDPKAKAA